MKPLEKVLMGCALGDSLGLPYEGLSRKRIAGMLGKGLRHSLLFDRGMLSDDTEHSIFVIRSFEKSSTPKEFARYMRSHLRFWLLTVPPGIGFGTLKSILKMWSFVKSSSVKTAGNGPLMRSAVLAVLLRDQKEDLREYVQANTYITHADIRALETSLLLSRLVHKNLESGFFTIDDLDQSSEDLENKEFLESIELLKASFNKKLTPDEYVQELGQESGVSGYCIHTFCAAVYANFYFKNDFKKIIHWCISCGGDTDSVAAVAGALAASSEKCELPEDLIANIKDWPFSVSYMKNIKGQSNNLKYPLLKMLFRNIFFVPLILVLAVIRIFR